MKLSALLVFAASPEARIVSYSEETQRVAEYWEALKAHIQCLESVLEKTRPQGAAGAARFSSFCPRARKIFKPLAPAPATIFQGPRGKSAPFFEMPFSFALGCFQAAETSLWFLF